MSTSGSPSREVKFIPETPPPVSQSLESSQEHAHLVKKPRNYKYWSDDEVKKILCWLILPENEGKLARNKAQACREVAKKLFDGDEYMAISVRSKLMSLEKGFREAEQLRQQLNSCTNDEVLINDKIKEVSKFHKECKLLFGNNRSDSYSSLVSTSPVTSNSSLPTPISSIPFSPSSNNNSNNRYHHHSQQQQRQQHPPYFSSHNNRPSSPPASSSSNSLPLTFSTNTSSTTTRHHHDIDSQSESLLPHLNEDRLSSLSIPPPLLRGSWSLPRVSTKVDLPPVEHNHHEHRKKQEHQYNNDNDVDNNLINVNTRLRIAKYAAKQASYAAKQAEYEALRSEHEENKMEYAVQLATIELDREALSIKKLELELELLKSKENRL